MNRSRAVSLAAVILVLVGLVVIGQLATSRLLGEQTASQPTVDGGSSFQQEPGSDDPLALLDGLREVHKVDVGDYQRQEHFGPTWPDLDGDGCSEREEALLRWMETAYSDDGCVILSGTLDDPYTGEVIEFRRGPDTSHEVQIDHVVALKDAWLSGASEWTQETREQFANDHRNLIAVDGPTNAAKGAKDASEWLPPDEAFHCEYVTLQVEIKAAYDLGVTAEERAAMEDVLVTCPRGES